MVELKCDYYSFCDSFVFEKLDISQVRVISKELVLEHTFKKKILICNHEIIQFRNNIDGKNKTKKHLNKERKKEKE